MKDKTANAGIKICFIRLFITLTLYETSRKLPIYYGTYPSLRKTLTKNINISQKK